MAQRSAIEWTDATWNPTAGCSVISPGCTNCYAMRLAARHEAMSAGHGRASRYAGLTAPSKAGPVWNGLVVADSAALKLPLSWRRGRRIFVNSMSDLFHEALPDAEIDRVFAVMGLAGWHDFQVLTKRAERMRAYASDPATPGRVDAAMNEIAPAHWCGRELEDVGGWPLPNVALGVSLEDQRHAEVRVPQLLATPAALRFVSGEPLLGPVDLGWALARNVLDIAAGLLRRGLFSPGLETLRPLDWVIIGGESGPGARPMHPQWARALRDACVRAGVPFFFKQWGEWTPGVNVRRRSGTVVTAAWFDRRWLFDRENLANDGHIDDEPDLYRVGRAAAGRTLDGRTWDGQPAWRSAAAA